MAALAIFVMLGSVYIAVVLMFFFVAAPIRVGLDLFEVKNSFEISAFLSFTFTSIIFSCKGKAIINRITIFWRGRNKEKIQGELNFINTYLGQNQIRFFIYLAYFIGIISTSLVHLSGFFKESTDENFLYLTLQSFIAFIAFETLVEKKSLMKPWDDKLRDFRKNP